MNEQYMSDFREKKYLFISLTVILCILLVFLTVWIGVGIQNKIKEGRYIGQDIESKNTITVSDKAEIYAKPDLALVTASITAEAKTVNEAMANNTKKMNAVIDFVKSHGVDGKDLKTTNFNIYPRYEWQRETICLIPPCPSGKRVLAGYEINQSLQIKIRDMEKIGDIIQGTTEAGANEISGLQFTIDREDDLRNQARDEAIEKAKTKAKGLASKLGVKLVRISNFTESGASPVPYLFRESVAGKGGGGEVPQIETGENKIEVAVTITYEID